MYLPSANSSFQRQQSMHPYGTPAEVQKTNSISGKIIYTRQAAKLSDTEYAQPERIC